MADLNLRDIEPELIKELKQAALDAGWSLKELCVHRLKGKTFGEIKRKAGDDPLAQAKAIRESAKPQMIIERPTKEKPTTTFRMEIPEREEAPRGKSCPECHAPNGMHQKFCSKK